MDEDMNADIAVAKGVFLYSACRAFNAIRTCRTASRAEDVNYYLRFLARASLDRSSPANGCLLHRLRRARHHDAGLPPGMGSMLGTADNGRKRRPIDQGGPAGHRRRV